MSDATRPETTEALARVLEQHGPSGMVNSREGWVECQCGGRLHLPSGLTFDGYAEMEEEEGGARDAHLATALLAAVEAGEVPGLVTSERLAEKIEAYADAEALRTRWDGKAGLLGNWVGGIRDAARIVRREGGGCNE